MKAIKYILLLVMLMISHAAHATEPVFGTSAQSKQARELTPPKGKAIVYIYQRHEDGSGVSPTIWLNNHALGRLVPGSFTVWQLSPGQLNLRVDGAEPARLSILSEAGKTYLFSLSVTQTAAGPQPILTSLPESYRPDMAATRLIKNPGKVTSAEAQSPAKSTPPPAAAKSVPAQPAAQASADPVTKPGRTPSVALQPGGMGLMLKTGSLTLSEEIQPILGTNYRFDDSASGLYAIEAYYQFNSGLSVGGELLGYTAEFTTVGLNDKHEVDVLILLANAKQYFRTESSLQPYLGAGLGIATTDISGPNVTGNSAGFAYQLIAGVEYRSTNIGVFGEFKYVSADTEDSSGESIDVSGSGLFAGVAFHF